MCVLRCTNKKDNLNGRKKVRVTTEVTVLGQSDSNDILSPFHLFSYHLVNHFLILNSELTQLKKKSHQCGSKQIKRPCIKEIVEINGIFLEILPLVFQACLILILFNIFSKHQESIGTQEERCHFNSHIPKNVQVNQILHTNY